MQIGRLALGREGVDRLELEGAVLAVFAVLATGLATTNAVVGCCINVRAH